MKKIIIFLKQKILIKNKSSRTFLGYKARYALFLILPSLLFFMVFNLYPIFLTVYLAFTNANAGELSGQFIGLSNFVRLFTVDRVRFFYSLYKTLLFVVVSVPLKVSLGVILAFIFASENMWGKKILRGLMLTPWALPILLSLTAWRAVLNPVAGPIPAILYMINPLSSSESSYFQSFPFDIFNHEWDAFVSYNLIEAWLAYPFIMTITLGAISSISKEIIESSMIDGAGLWIRFRHIVLPQVKRPVLFATLLTTGASFQAFMVPLLLNGGGPVVYMKMFGTSANILTNEFLLLFGYDKAFQAVGGGEYGYAASIFLIVVMILAIYYMIALKVTGLSKGARE